eukprot:scaffold7589_cov106-Isochrysis_galbana.AAC.6
MRHEADDGGDGRAVERLLYSSRGFGRRPPPVRVPLARRRRPSLARHQPSSRACEKLAEYQSQLENVAVIAFPTGHAVAD